MLVLSRKRSEGITISHPDGNIHIIVVEIRDDKVRIGVEADKNISVHRDEVYNAIHRKSENQEDAEKCQTHSN